MQDKYLTKDQMQTILDSRPKGVSMDDALNMYVKNGWTIQGVNEKKVEPTLGSKLATTGKQVVSDVKDTVSRVYNGETSPAVGTVQVIGDAARGIVNGTSDVVSSTPVVGDAMKGLSDNVITPAVQGIQSLVSKGLNTKLAQDILAHPYSDKFASFLESNPDVARTATSITDIANAGLILDGGVTSAVKGKDLLSTGASKVSMLASDATKTITNKVNTLAKPTEQQAVANTEKGIMDIVDNSKSLVKDFAKREGTGKNPVKMIAENPDYAVKVNPESKTIDATDAISNMQRDIKSFSEVRDRLLQTADQTLPPIKTNDILNKTLDVFSAKNYSTYLDEGERAVKGIVNKLKVLQKYNPETVSRTTLNDVRKGLDETINSFTNTKLKDKVRLDLRKVFQTTLEDSIPESGLLKNLNAQIGDIIDAHGFTSERLNGTKVKGGGLTDLAMKTAGASTGAVLAGTGGMIGGIPGAVGGYMLSNFLSKQLIKNAINNPFDRKVLEGLRQQTPDIVRQAEEFISNTSKKASSATSKTPAISNTTNFERASGLTETNRQVETNAFNKILSSEQDILDAYKAKHGNEINTDNFRPFFKDEGYNGANAAAVQEPSSYLAKKAFTDALTNDGEYATFSAGGSGAGKSSGIKSIQSLTNLVKNSAVVFDSNLSSYSSAIKKIREAEAAGKKFEGIYTYRDPVDSLVNGVIKRMTDNADEMGRIVPTKVIADNHINSLNVVKKLIDEGYNFRVVDNSLGAGKAALSDINTIINKAKYPSVKELTDILNKKVKELYNAGKLTPEQYKEYTN